MTGQDAGNCVLQICADMCIAHGIDGFVLLALLDEEGGLESIGVISAVDKAKVRGGIRKMTMEVGSPQRINAVEMEADKMESVIEVQQNIFKVGGWWGPISLSMSFSLSPFFFLLSLSLSLSFYSFFFFSLCIFSLCLLSFVSVQSGWMESGWIEPIAKRVKVK